MTPTSPNRGTHRNRSNRRRNTVPPPQTQDAAPVVNASKSTRRPNSNRPPKIPAPLSSPSSERSHFITDHTANPIIMPNIYQEPRPRDLSSVQGMLARSDPELQRQGKFLFDDTHSCYYTKISPPFEIEQAKRMRNAWATASRQNLKCFLIPKHWNSRHQLIKEPMLIVRRHGNRFVAESTHGWILYRKSIYESRNPGSFQMRIKGFVQEFCLKLKVELGENRPKWFNYLWYGYIITKHMPHSLNSYEADLICNQVFTLILYILDYHRIDVRTITEFAGIERNPVLTAGHLSDVTIFLPRFLLEHQSGLEDYPFSDKDRELCAEWNMKETVASRRNIQKAFRAIRL
ncbi:hypothetical protein GEMRC1_006034 [Eukaryota sp. GEM-RC1]